MFKHFVASDEAVRVYVIICSCISSYAWNQVENHYNRFNHVLDIATKRCVCGSTLPMGKVRVNL